MFRMPFLQKRAYQPAANDTEAANLLRQARDGDVALKRHLKDATEKIGTPFDFRVFSQNGEDGILHHLTKSLGIYGRPFVEFGFHPHESNTLQYAVMSGAEGLYIDESEEHCAHARSLYGRAGMKALTVSSWIDAETINDVIASSGISTRRVAILSVDMDGNDYWVWRAINVVRPLIVVTEYNASFGPLRACTIPYKRDFVRGAGPDGIYHGMSLRGAERLAREKGYSLFCCDETGLNAFFVRSDKLSSRIKSQSAEKAFRPHSRRIEAGLSQSEQEDMAFSKGPVVDVN